MNYHYLVIPYMKINNANAQPALWFIGPPPVTAYTGFAQALTLALGAKKHAGIGIVHHDIQFLGEQHYRNLHPHHYRAASFIDSHDYVNSNKYVLSTQPTVRCHLLVSIVIRFDIDEVLDLAQVARFLRGGRLAGGAIISHEFDRNNNHCFFEEEHDESRVSNVLGSGFALHERQDLMIRQEGDLDMLDVLLRVTHSDAEKHEDHSWIQPTTLGYVRITDVKMRNKVRGGFPHAYAEPLVGLVQYRNLRQFGLPFWQFTHPRPEVIVATTT